MTDFPKKIYLIAGEASGDLHGANLVRALKSENSHLQFRFWGGDLMATEIGQPVKHIKDLAFMGFVEVLKNIRTILSNIKLCKKDIVAFKPDALVLIDYPGFNLRIAEWAKSEGIKVYYYISPQVWAWKQSRVHKIKKTVDHMYVILPFEKDFYAKFDYKVEYVGHPLLDEIERFYALESGGKDFKKKFGIEDKQLIAILPGSRKQEIEKKLPVMLESIKGLTDFQFVIACAPALELEFYEQFVKGNKQVTLVQNQTYPLLAQSTAAIVTSGTATLETALFSVPEVVCYKANAISYYIAKKLIKIRFISLVNLIMDKEVVKELIQENCSPEKIKEELMLILPGGAKREHMLKEYQMLHQKLGLGGASKKVAQSLLKTI